MEKYSIRKEVDKVNEIDFIVNYPFGYIPEIEQNSVTFIFGLSYDLKNFYWQNITVFDSKCRTCKNGILDEKLVY